MMGQIIPLILFTEAEKKTTASKDTTDDDAAADDDADDAATTDDADDAATTDDADDAATTDDADDDDDDDNFGSGESEAPVDPEVERVKRESLYDAVVDVQQSCDLLLQSCDTLIDRIEDKAGKDMALRAKKILTDTVSQCDVIRTRFAELGYERVRDLYATARERVAAVAEIVKHVIDGDDDFRKSDSGDHRRNGRASEQGRGKSA